MVDVAVEIPKQRHLGKVVDQLTVDVQHQDRQRRVGERSLGRTAGSAKPGFAERAGTPSIHNPSSCSSWVNAPAAVPEYENVE